MHHLRPKVSSRSTWNREKRKRQTTLWHTHKPVDDGPQLRVSDDEHQLQHRQLVRSTPTTTIYIHCYHLNMKDKYLLVRTLGWSDELHRTMGQLRSSPLQHTVAVPGTAACYYTNYSKDCETVFDKPQQSTEIFPLKCKVLTSNKLRHRLYRSVGHPLRHPSSRGQRAAMSLSTWHL